MIPHHILSNSPSILMIEENETLSNWLYKELSQKYSIVTVGNLSEAIWQLDKLNPSLILIGIGLNTRYGYQICDELRKHDRSWFIPRIIFNSLDLNVDRKAIWKVGADAFFTPPLDIDEILLRIETMINMRRKLMPSPIIYKIKKNESILDRKDRAFLDKLKKIVHDNIGIEDFSASDLAREIGLSHSQLYRRLKKITGKNCGEFIRHQRLERAVYLIKEDSATISEISYNLGFGSPSYFTRCFRQKYGCSPSKFVG